MSKVYRFIVTIIQQMSKVYRFIVTIIQQMSKVYRFIVTIIQQVSNPSEVQYNFLVIEQVCIGCFI